MSDVVLLSTARLARVRAVAAVLLPGAAGAPSAVSLPEFDELVRHAAAALDGGGRALYDAIDALPAEPTEASLRELAASDPAAFGQLSLLVTGAYFMSPSVLASLGLPTGERRAADLSQVVDEIETGVLDAVLERGCPVRTLAEVNSATERSRA